MEDQDNELVDSAIRRSHGLQCDQLDPDERRAYIAQEEALRKSVLEWPERFDQD